MKVVLTGATGFAGAEILRHLVTDPAVTTITCLSRRPVTVGSPEVETVVLDDFTRYPDDLVARLADHDACVWALGAKSSDTRDPALYARVTHGFTLALATSLAAHLTKRFVFCYLSGAGADPSESARLPWERLTRHLKGRTEADLRALSARHPDLDVHCFRPGGILPTTTNRVLAGLAAPISVGVDRLADAMIAVATGRAVAPPAVISNGAIKAIAAGS